MANVKITLEAARVNAGLSQRQAAGMVGVSVQTLINWEKGRTSPSITQGRALSGIYNMPFDYIFLPAETN